MSVPSAEGPDYGAVEYWNERYVKERQRGPDHFFDWYCTYDESALGGPGDRAAVPGLVDMRRAGAARRSREPASAWAQ